MQTSPPHRKAPRIALRLFAVAVLAALVGGGLYFQGWYTDCRPGTRGGEACNITQGIGLIFDVAVAILVFLLGTIVVLILHWFRKRRAVRLH